MKDSVDALYARRKAALKQNKSPPYLFDHFNVRSFYKCTGVKGVNRSLHCQKFESALVMGSTLHYLIWQVDMFIDRRKQDIADKKPGALPQEGYPQVIWVRMLRRPSRISDAVSIRTRKALALRGKFNSILEERLFNGIDKVHRIMSIEVESNEFDFTGGLTSAGKSDSWREVNRAMWKFDTGAITLMPRKSHQPAALSGNKLPTPPPESGKKWQFDRISSGHSGTSAKVHHGHNRSHTKQR